jgi:CBS-domain-containing membrane protein
MDYESEINDLKERVTKLEASLDESKAELKSFLDQTRFENDRRALRALACADFSFGRERLASPSYNFLTMATRNKLAARPTYPLLGVECTINATSGEHQPVRKAALGGKKRRRDAKRGP